MTSEDTLFLIVKVEKYNKNFHEVYLSSFIVYYYFKYLIKLYMNKSG
jgi:hypothetical protein